MIAEGDRTDWVRLKISYEFNISVKQSVLKTNT